MRTCVVCGCTDDFACEGGCSWYRVFSKKTGLCSECPAPANPKDLLIDDRIQLRRLKASVAVLNRARRTQMKAFAIAAINYDRAVEELRAFHMKKAGNFRNDV